jgi:putative transposase
MAVRVISKVAEAYKRDKSRKPSFRAHGAIVYDQRVLAWKGVDRVSILDTQRATGYSHRLGRVSGRPAEAIRGQADLIYRNGTFYLAVVADVPEPPAGDPKDWLGVDLGIVNIAADADGEAYSGGHLNGLRKRHARLRAQLQGKSTRSAKRLLKKRSGKERRFATNVNHVISKRLVAKARGTGRGIALEDLKASAVGSTVKKAQRRSQHSWAFAQLRSFIEYKAGLAGVPVAFVDPRNTSRTCLACGCIDGRNRPTEGRYRPSGRRHPAYAASAVGG